MTFTDSLIARSLLFESDGSDDAVERMVVVVDDCAVEDDAPAIADDVVVSVPEDVVGD
jgi:hypothetical protein